MAEKGGSVSIYARLRKIMQHEDKSLSATAIDSKTILNRTTKRSQAYEFTQVFKPSDDNIKCFNMICKPLLNNVLNGYNAILMTYGQTGSGKTYSILGKIHKIHNKTTQHPVKGLLTLSLEHLLHSCTSSIKYLELSAVETFGHHIQKIRSYDLADPHNQIQAWDKKQAMKSSSNIRNNAQKIRINANNIQSSISTLHSCSHFAPTGKNPESSRGHICYVTAIHLINGIVSYYIVVDLAGSEGDSAINAKGYQATASPSEIVARRLEAWCINHGLSQLQVIFAELRGIKKKGASVGTGLKKTLSEFLNRSACISVLFTISPSVDNSKSTEATLRFAECCALVKCKPVKQEKKINKDNLIQELRQYIAGQKCIIIEKNQQIAQLEKRFDDVILRESNEEKLPVNLVVKLTEFEVSVDEEKKWVARKEKGELLSCADELDLEQSMKDQMSEVRRASRVSAELQFVSQKLLSESYNNNIDNIGVGEDVLSRHMVHSSITSMHTIVETDDESSDMDEYRVNKILIEHKNGYELHSKSLQGLNRNELLFLCTKFGNSGSKSDTDVIIEAHEQQIQYLSKELNRLQGYHNHRQKHSVCSLSLQSDVDVKICINDDDDAGQSTEDKQVSPSSSRIDPMAAYNDENISFINQQTKQKNISSVLDDEDDEKMIEDEVEHTTRCTDNCIIL